MYKNYTSMVVGKNAQLRTGKITSFKAKKDSWIIMILMILSMAIGQRSWGQTVVTFGAGQNTALLSENFESAWTTAATLSPAWSSVGLANNQWQMSSNTADWSYPTGGAYSPLGANSTSQSARSASHQQ